MLASWSFMRCCRLVFKRCLMELVLESWSRMDISNMMSYRFCHCFSVDKRSLVGCGSMMHDLRVLCSRYMVQNWWRLVGCLGVMDRARFVHRLSMLRKSGVHCNLRGLRLYCSLNWVRFQIMLNLFFLFGSLGGSCLLRFLLQGLFFQFSCFNLVGHKFFEKDFRHLYVFNSCMFLLHDT